MKNQKKQQLLPLIVGIIVGMYGAVWHADAYGERRQSDSKKDDTDKDKPKDTDTDKPKSDKPKSTDKDKPKDTDKDKPKDTGKKSSGKKGSSGKGSKRRAEKKEKEVKDMNPAEYADFLIKKTNAVTSKKGSYSQRFTEFTELSAQTKPQVSDTDYEEKKATWVRFKAGLKENLNV